MCLGGKQGQVLGIWLQAKCHWAEDSPQEVFSVPLGAFLHSISSSDHSLQFRIAVLTTNLQIYRKMGMLFLNCLSQIFLLSQAQMG